MTTGPERSVHLPGSGLATDYARQLLESLGIPVTSGPGPADPEPWVASAESGLLALTGRADGPALVCPAPLASCADGAIIALRALAGGAAVLPRGAALLGERAAIAGWQRSGTRSPGGGCQLLRASDRWLAVSLARASDWELVPAWLETEGAASWPAIRALVARAPAALLVDRARLLGLAAAVATQPDPQPPPWLHASAIGARRPVTAPHRPPRVLDLSSLWAGPLCGSLLQMLGADVVKVESRGRPDGARAGPAPFYDLLNAGKASVALDFNGPELARLHELLAGADLVIEASRPRALRQLGVLAEDWLAARPGRTWVSLTGYGRDGPAANHVAFGDDAGVAAGLTGLLQQASGSTCFCGDAVADPLAGLHAALAACASHRAGGGRLLSLALRDVAAHCLAWTLPATVAERRARWQRWMAAVEHGGRPATLPAPRVAPGPARPPGADNAAVFARWRPAAVRR